MTASNPFQQQASMVIHAPVDALWDVISDISHYWRWNPIFVDTHLPKGTAEGMPLKVKCQMLRGQMDKEGQITHIRPQTSLAFHFNKLHPKCFQEHWCLSLTPIDDLSTKVTLSIQYEGWLKVTYWQKDQISLIMAGDVFLSSLKQKMEIIEHGKSNQRP